MTEPTRWRKAPVEVDAIQLRDDNSQAVARFASGSTTRAGIEISERHRDCYNRVYVVIYTLEGTMRANEGDWIIRGVKGELYPCRDDIFRMTYEPVSTPAPATVGRATVLREAAELAERLMDERYGPDCAYAIGGLDVATELRRLAEAQQDETRCKHGCDTSTCPCLACEADDDAREARQEPTQDSEEA